MVDGLSKSLGPYIKMLSEFGGLVASSAILVIFGVSSAPLSGGMSLLVSALGVVMFIVGILVMANKGTSGYIREYHS